MSFLRRMADLFSRILNRFRTRNILADIRVSEVFKRLDPPPVFDQSTRVSDLPDTVFEADSEIVFVRDAAGRIVGSVPCSRLRAVPTSGNMQSAVILFDLMEPFWPVTVVASLFFALAAMRRRDLRILPVVGAEGEPPCGYITVEIILDAYAAAMTGVRIKPRKRE